MESNQELMILSLLNLYVSYVDLNRRCMEKSDKKPFYSRYATKFQTLRTLNKEGQGRNNHLTAVCYQKGKAPDQIKPAGHSESTLGPQTNTNIAFTTDKKMEITISDTRTIAYSNESITYTPTNHGIIADITETTTEKEKKKSVIKRRKRGKGNKSTEDKKPRQRRWRVRPINRDRALTGYHRKVFSNIKKMDQQQFFEHTRMSKSLFDWLLTIAHSSLRKKRQLILAEERLAITLNYLAYGTPLQSIAWKHKVGKSTARQIVLDTCTVLWNLLSPIYLTEPTTSQYADIAEDFRSKLDIPNCVGAIEGKHVSISLPSKSTQINQDGLSVLILGVCDTKYKFSAVSVGNFNNQIIDGKFHLSPINYGIISDKLPLPSSKPLFKSSPPFPHFFISDTSFPLRKNIMRPYEGMNLDETKSLFNYKIFRAHTVTENAFGILTARFRVLLTTIEFLPENCRTIILACIALHNFILTNDEEQLYCPATFVDRENDSGIIEEGEWRTELRNNGDQPLPSMISNNSKSSLEANSLRDTLANFFANETISYEIEIIEPN